MGNDSRVLLDLNYLEFQKELFNLDVGDVRKIFATFKKLRAMTWQEIFKDKGLHWEEVKTVSGKYTVRLSQSYRAVVRRDGDYMRFASLHPDHDGAYGRK
ncbi:MAG: hypothetical protein JWP36_778 [Paucimonas sp.]|nr:hypothetical protein [Paucimonas sp.]